MTPERRAKLMALAELHDRYVAAKADSAPFEPDGSADYNVHHVTLTSDADDAFHAEASKIFES